MTAFRVQNGSEKLKVHGTLSCDFLQVNLQIYCDAFVFLFGKHMHKHANREVLARSRASLHAIAANSANAASTFGR